MASFSQYTTFYLISTTYSCHNSLLEVLKINLVQYFGLAVSWLFVGCFLIFDDFIAAIVNAILIVDLWAVGGSTTKSCSTWKPRAASLALIVLAFSINFSVITHVVVIHNWPSLQTTE